MVPMNSFDIIVVGLGPAGATFARSVSDKYRILAIDAKGEQSPFQKPCGGLLAPDAQKTIAEMGFHINKDLLVDPQIFSVHTIDFQSKLERDYQRAYFNLDRHAFDMWCIAQIPDTVKLESSAKVTAILKTDQGYTVDYTTPHGRYQATTRYLIGADGANSIVRKAIYPKHRIRTYLSIQEWYQVSDSRPFYASIFDPEATDCYSWALYKNDYLLFGGAYPQTGARQRFENQKQKLIDHGYPLQHPIKRQACLVLRPEKLSDIVTGKDNAYLIGEAAGWVSPSSLEGISYALISARELARTFPDRPHYRKLKLKLLSKIIKSPFLYQPTIRRIIMGSGLQSIKISKSRQP